jgi:hypothetical protein
MQSCLLRNGEKGRRDKLQLTHMKNLNPNFNKGEAPDNLPVISVAVEEARTPRRVLRREEDAITPQQRLYEVIDKIFTDLTESFKRAMNDYGLSIDNVSIAYSPADSHEDAITRLGKIREASVALRVRD